MHCFKSILPLLLVLSLTSMPIAAAAPVVFDGRVIRIIDGDTIVVLVDQQRYSVRLDGIDAPEKGQPFWAEAREALSDKVYNKTVSVWVRGKEKTGPILGDVAHNKSSINEQLITEGIAWHLKGSSKSPELAEAEKRARDARCGLWADAKPIAPWDWRESEAERRKDVQAKKKAIGAKAAALQAANVQADAPIEAVDPKLARGAIAAAPAEKTQPINLNERIAWLPEPFDALDSNDPKSRNIQTIVGNYERQKQVIVRREVAKKQRRMVREYETFKIKGSEFENLPKIKELDKRLMLELDPLITPQQMKDLHVRSGKMQEQIKIRSRNIREGIEIGNGLHRAYRVEEVFEKAPERPVSRSDSSWDFYMHTLRSSINGPSHPARIAVVFTILNKSGDDYRWASFTVDFRNGNGERLERRRATIEGIANGESVKLKINDPPDFRYVEVKVTDTLK